MTEPAHRYRSPLLGQPLRLPTRAGEIEAFERGDGPALVFAHGWLANANLWRHVVDRLAAEFRCIVLDLPLGAHRLPAAADADLDAEGCGALLADALEALDLDRPTLVGNDSGGAYSQIALGHRPDLAARLVLRPRTTSSRRRPSTACPPRQRIPRPSASSSARSRIPR